MYKLVPIFSLVCQLAFFVALVFAIADLYVYVNHWQPWEDPDPRMVRTVINGKLFKMVILLIGGLIGAILSWIALRKIGERPGWFVVLTKLLASFWLVLFPIGTIVGILMFRWQQPLPESNRTG